MQLPGASEMEVAGKEYGENVHDPEETHTFHLHNRGLPTMEGVEELDGGHELGVDGPGGVH